MKIITGMHRSGTSAVARLFYEAGTDMGDVRTFYRPDKWNPDGYYEQSDIHAINMPLINGPWWKLAYFRLPSTKTIMKRAHKRAELIRATAEKYKYQVVKETRFCLTLPAWLEYGAQVDRILVCLREPIQVANSIRKRNLIPIRLGLELWHIHNNRLLEHLREIPTWFVLYNNILDRRFYLSEIDCAFRFFGYELETHELAQIYRNSIKPHMNHNPGCSATYPSKIDDLWQYLLRRHREQFQTEFAANK